MLLLHFQLFSNSFFLSLFLLSVPGQPPASAIHHIFFHCCILFLLCFCFCFLSSVCTSSGFSFSFISYYLQSMFLISAPACFLVMLYFPVIDLCSSNTSNYHKQKDSSTTTSITTRYKTTTAMYQLQQTPAKIQNHCLHHHH